MLAIDKKQNVYMKFPMQILKQKTLNLLQLNHQQIWQSLTLSILNHIQFTLNKSRSIKQLAVNNQVQKWLKQQIQNILSWISDPQNRLLLIYLKKKQIQWKKQQKQWQSTFQKLLLSKSAFQEQQNKELSHLMDQIASLKRQNEQIYAKNSVLQSIIKMYSTYQEKQFIHKRLNYSQSYQKLQSNYKISQKFNKFQKNNNYNKFQQKIKQSNKLENLQIEYIDVQTMTVQMLENNKNCKQNQKIMMINQQYSIQLQNIVNQIKQPIKIINKRNQLKIAQNFSMLISLNDKQVKQYQTNTENKKNFIYETFNLSIFYQTSKDMEIKQQNRQTKVSQNQKSLQLDISVSSSQSSSSSSYILECDRGTQTQNQAQTNKNNNIASPVTHSIDQTLITPFLLKLSNLQRQLQHKNTQIQRKDQQVKMLLNNLQSSQKREKQYKNDIRINQELQNYAKQQLETTKKQYQNLQQKYKQLLSTFTEYMEIGQSKNYSKYSPSHRQLQLISLPSPFSPFIPINNFSHNMKQGQIDDQLLTTQSQSQESIHGCKNISNQFIDRSTIAKYLLSFMQLQIENGSQHKKLTVLFTILSVLGMKNDHQIIKRFIQKISLKIKIKQQQQQQQKQQQIENSSEQKQSKESLHQIFFRYLTKQS